MDHGNFDERAATWDDDPAKVERARVVATKIREVVAPRPGSRLLEYGAGTGLVSQALRADVGPVTVADTSAGMREVLEAKVASGALPHAEIWDVDLAAAPPPAGAAFDLVVTVLVLHHIPDIAPVLAAFAELLDDGGHLCVADLEQEDGSFHGPGFQGHHGFGRQGLTDALEEAGFSGVTFHDAGAVERDAGRFPVFLAVARR